MPRPLRHIEPGLIYHVLNCGNGRMMIFRTDADFEAFLKILAEGLKRFDVELLAWCLMSNHWHLVLRPRRAGQLQAFMQWITLTHVRRHHEHHRRACGHLYQGRYKHFPVEQDEYLLVLLQYVEGNALRAGLVERAQDWPWSSLHQRLRKKNVSPLSDWPVDRPADWTRTVNQAMEEPKRKQVRQSIERDRPLGSPAWVRKMSARLGLEQTLRERGRPRGPMEKLSPRQRRRREQENRSERDVTPF
jgi:putative transposase